MMEQDLLKIDRIMKNIVIAAGYATRLGELTKNLPEAFVEDR